VPQAEIAVAMAQLHRVAEARRGSDHRQGAVADQDHLEEAGRCQGEADHHRQGEGVDRLTRVSGNQSQCTHRHQGGEDHRADRQRHRQVVGQASHFRWRLEILGGNRLTASGALTVKDRQQPRKPLADIGAWSPVALGVGWLALPLGA
jgi:hypothetical protein